MKALLLTGGLASGKTAVAVEAGEVLAERGVANAVIDLDWLCWVSGADVHGLMTANLRAVGANYARAGVSHLVLARALLEPAHLDAVRQGLPGVALTVVRLVASQETVMARLRGRDAGAVLEGHLAEAAAFTARVAAAGLEDHVVTNDGRPIREVAGAVLKLF